MKKTNDKCLSGGDITPISLELSDDMKKHLEHIKIMNCYFENEMCKTFMIPKNRVNI